MANSVSSAVDICNLALLRLGQNQITTLQDATTAARSCNVLYEPTRDAVLRGFPWRFARTRVQLAADGTAPQWGFDYRYELPADFMFVHETDFDEVEYPWQVEGTHIYTDAAPPISIVYIRKVTSPPSFDALFLDALVELLASRLAMPITRQSSLEEKHFQIYARRIDEARTIDSQQGTPFLIEADDLTDARI